MTFVPRRVAWVGMLLLTLALSFYAALWITTTLEQSKTLGEKNLGVAALFMMFGVPMALCAAGAALSFLAAGIVFAYQRLAKGRS